MHIKVPNLRILKFMYPDPYHIASDVILVALFMHLKLQTYDIIKKNI